MTRYGFVIDIGRCNGCDVCVIACKDQFIGNAYSPYNVAQPDLGHLWMDVKTYERGTFPEVKASYIPLPCMHCADAPCQK